MSFAPISIGTWTYAWRHVESSRGVGGVSLSDEPEGEEAPLSDGSTVRLHAEPVSGPVEEGQDEDIVVYVPGDRVLIFSADAPETTSSRWGRSVSRLTRRELASLVRTLDPAAQALIKARQMTGHLVELHPIDVEMLKGGAQWVTEDGGWIQSTLRDKGRYARVMRIRPETAAAALTRGAFVLAAITAQAQTEAIARDVRAIRQRVEDVYTHQQDDQVGAVRNAVAQVEDLVAMLREHGPDGVDASGFSVIRNCLGDARSKCLQHLKTALAKAEAAGHPGVSPREAASEILTQQATEDVLLYLDLLETLYATTVQFGLAQVAFDYHEGKLDVARTRVERLTSSTDELRGEVDRAWVRVGRLAQGVRAQFQPWWKTTGKEIGTKAALGASSFAGLGLIGEKAPPLAKRTSVGHKGGAALAAIGLVSGLGWGVKNTVQDVRAKNALDHRLGQFKRARESLQIREDPATPSLAWLRDVTGELADPGEGVAVEE